MKIIESENKWPKKIRAAVLFEIKKPLKIINLNVPKLKKGQVLVKLFLAGICHSQIMEINGLRGKNNYLPHLLGHEGCGQVIDVGKNVNKVKKGQSVILGWIKGDGNNVGGATYLYKNLKINSGPITTFSDYTIVSENRLTTLPNGLNTRDAVLFGCAIPTGAGMIFNETKLKKNSVVAICGIGGVGIFSLISAKIFKCKTIIAIDINDKKLSLAKKYGATHTINTKKENLIDKIKLITKNNNVDFSFDCAGKIKTIENCFSILNDRGVCIFCSHPEYNKKIQIDPFDLILGKKIYGSWGGAIHPDRDLKKIYNKFLLNKVDLSFFSKNIYKFTKINKAIEDLKKGKVLRPIIKFD